MDKEEGPAQAAGGGAGGGGGQEDAATSCSLCGDVGFRGALLPCSARGCSRLQHTYCGGRYCPPDVVHDAGSWRCEWCAPLHHHHHRRLHHEEDDPSTTSKRPRRTTPPPSPDIKLPADTSLLLHHHRESRPPPPPPASSHHPEPSILPVVTAHAPPPPSTGTTPVSPVRTNGGSRARDRWKNLANRTTRLGVKKYKLLADVLC